MKVLFCDLFKILDSALVTLSAYAIFVLTPWHSSPDLIEIHFTVFCKMFLGAVCEGNLFRPLLVLLVGC